MAVCKNCGRQNADDAWFCSGCAAPLDTGHPPPRAVRKVVTVLFCDLVESTPLGERLDPESLRRVMARWHRSTHAHSRKKRDRRHRRPHRRGVGGAAHGRAPG